MRMTQWQQLGTIQTIKHPNFDLQALLDDENLILIHFWSFIEKGRWINQIYTACFRYMWE